MLALLPLKSYIVSSRTRPKAACLQAGKRTVDDIVDDLIRIAERCERAARAFKADPLTTLHDNLIDACESLEAAWSGSWLGYHASVYTEGLRPRQPGEHFDSEWGMMDRISNKTVGVWREYDYDTVYQEIMRRSGDVDTDLVTQAARRAKQVFSECRADLLPTLDALLADCDDETVRAMREKTEKMDSHTPASKFIEAIRPHGRSMSRDKIAIQAGQQAPHHRCLQAWLLEEESYGTQAGRLAEVARHAARYLQKRKKMKGQTVARTEGPVFIGHGGSPAWKDLKDFLVDRLDLKYEEFNRQPVAGLSTKERLLEMLDTCCFAFLVMTAEDEGPDGNIRARQNVIHEAGLFQGRYGFERSIILLEDGCEEFSNIHGIGQIRFPKGNVKAVSEDIRRVLEREGVLPTR